MQITTEFLNNMLEEAKKVDKEARTVDLIVADTHYGQLPGGLYELAIRRSAEITTLAKLVKISEE